MSDTFAKLLARVAAGETLDAEDAGRAFGAIMEGVVAPAAMASFLTALARRKATVAEIVGAASAMRTSMKPVEAPENAIDLCGTGGDARGTLNISTAAAFVVAGAGVPVAKHGNRAMSSRTGGADVLEALGARFHLEPSAAAACLQKNGICFLFAQDHHPAMRHAAPVRRALGFRTIFNLVGPLANPARVKRQLVGVYAKEWLAPVGEALKELASERAWVVHGTDGMDEVTTTGPTDIAMLEEGAIHLDALSPDDAGLARASIGDLAGGSADDNAGAIRKLFDGDGGPFRDIVLMNAAAALIIAGKAATLDEGVTLARQSIDSGAARRALAGYIDFTRKAAR